MEWEDPSTGKLHGFPAKLRFNDRDAMEGIWFHWEHGHETIEGLQVDMITRPSLRIYGVYQFVDNFTPPYTVHAHEMTILRPIHVLVDCDREIFDENETYSSGDDQTKSLRDHRQTVQRSGSPRK